MSKTKFPREPFEKALGWIAPHWSNKVFKTSLVDYQAYGRGRTVTEEQLLGVPL
ncbi:hypothetical protein Poly51_62930 [Rubripirellula tenax]|uniref:Uncharacterized protein n=1 Tax=Rubripirellula tenax TaxID=2528015 RepID=A0A5C6E803_9BACT|nr:hypothetical protein Poly51_62930 [Rubripirellula tenax]